MGGVKVAIESAGYLGAAVIAASAAFIGTVLAKEQKTTEFRQDWINAQRDDVAAMLALAANAHEDTSKNIEARAKFDEAFARLRLRENPDNKEWFYVIEELGRLRSAAFEFRVLENLAASDRRVVEISQRLLKDEWMRVRAGEPWFKVAKYLLPPLIFFVGLALAWGEGFIVIR